jgi:hypothetical protein
VRRSLILAGLLLLLACQTSFATPATPAAPTTTAAVPYDATCGVPIPDGVVVRSLPDPDTCVGPMSDQLKARADTRNSDLAPPIEPKVTNTQAGTASSESGQSATTTLDTGNYDAKCGVPVPDGVIIRSLPDPDTCIGPLSDRLKALADTRNPNLAPPPEPKATKLSQTQAKAAVFGNMQSPTTSTYESGYSGYGIYSNGDSNGVLSYLGANYPYSIPNPSDNHQFNIWSEAIQPPRSCLYNAIIHERNDYVHYLSGQADRIIYGNSCTAALNYAWGLNDPGVQQQIIITTGTGPVAAGQIKEVSPGCFNSYVYNKVTSTWNFVAQACQIDNLYPQGYVQWAATALGQTPLWCPVLPTHPWVEATLKLHNGVWQAPNPSVDWVSSQSSNCVVNGDSYIVTSLIVDPTYGAYVTWANQ